jgi:hypothetical protein
MLTEHLADDLRHRALLEHPVVMAQVQARQARLQPGVVVGEPRADGALAEVSDDAMHTGALVIESEERRLVEHGFERQAGFSLTSSISKLKSLLMASSPLNAST